MKKTLWVLLAILVAIQFIPAHRPAVSTDNPADIITNNSVPEPIQTMLHNACYDCHSNQTNYPWYSYVAPVSYLVIRDIREGKKELNFSEWENLTKKDKLKILGEISEVVLDGEMPMKIYPPLHPEAKLSEQNRKDLAAWADGFAELVFEQ
jgi:hypothetical protein